MTSSDLCVIDGPNGPRIFLGKEFPGVYLTEREAEIAQLLEDYKYREIADLMNISRRTAEYYALNMKKKLNCHNKREMVYVLSESGVVEKLKEIVDISYLFEGKDKENTKPAAEGGDELSADKADGDEDESHVHEDGHDSDGSDESVSAS